MTTARSILCALVLVGWALTACTPEPDRELVFVEDFETLCDGVPCGWVLSRGPDESASAIQTLPGDHGLLVRGDGVLVRGPAPGPLTSPRLGDLVTARVSARCDADSSISIRATLEEVPTAAGTRVITFEAEVFPADTWDRAPRDQTMDPTEGEGGTYQVRSVLGVSLLKNGAGDCEIDHLAIRVANLPGF